MVVTNEFFHDIRNSLATIALNIETIRTSTNDPQLIKPALLAWKNIQLIVRFMEANQSYPPPPARYFSVNREIKSAIQALHHTIIQHHAHIEITHFPQVKLLGSSIKFFQIILNLIANALDAYPKTTSQSPQPVVRVALHHTSDWVHIDIQDFGCGMSIATQQQMCTRFYTTKQDQGGSGLGLAIVKETIENYFNGSLRCCSILDQGTWFRISIPLSLLKNRSKKI